MDISLVIPAYNESGIIMDTIQTVSARLAELTAEYEVLIVDDGSTDGMAELVRGCGDPRVRLEGYASNRGKGCAVRTGMLAAQGDLILCTDADLAYGVDVFAGLLERLRTGEADLVIGSRRMGGEGYKNYPPLRILMSKCFGLLSHMISGLPYDTQCGIKAYRRQAARAIFSRCTTDGPVSVINFRESKVNVVRDSARMFRDVFRIRKKVRSGK